MLDTGLLLSGVVVVVAMWLVVRWIDLPWPPSEALDRLVAPAMVGVLIGRASALVLDDPTSLRSLRAFLVVRGGVELWPGAAAAAAVLAASLRRRGEPVLTSMALLVPVALVGYGAFEATCLLREGCYGPESAIGLRPDGLASPMVPLGVVVGVALVAIAWVLTARAERPPVETLAIALLAVAGLRSIAAIWLPRLGDALTRPHRESIAVAVIGLAVVLGSRVQHRMVLR